MAGNGYDLLPIVRTYASDQPVLLLGVDKLQQVTG
jgi:hypothetical protein